MHGGGLIMENGWLAVIAAVTSGTISPLLLSMLTNRQRRRDKLEDWARQDAVAAQAAAAAELLLAANERVASGTKVTNDKLDVIHTLVNSSMTAAVQAEHDATVRELAMMREVVALHRAAGREVSGESLAAIAATESKIAELKTTLADRLAQSKIVEAQLSDQRS